ncbi:hypothetical protein CAEBREN_04226 [Caenorhabditis brenneri]|uniref:Uncharacterized protein n=1 Tax=Caenorhabditis brenneri TaxID=135651 RepID=G0MBG7_CAEBE|nr:hypothetical protein CAEBREN_04226 [Caenorhabditis brenneri]
MVAKGMRRSEDNGVIHDIKKLANFKYVRKTQLYTVHWKDGSISRETFKQLNHHAVWIYWEKAVIGLTDGVRIMKERDLTDKEKRKYEECKRSLMELGKLRDNEDVVDFGFESGNFIKYHSKVLERMEKGDPNPFEARPGDDEIDEASDENDENRDK